jgi:putative transposase
MSDTTQLQRGQTYHIYARGKDDGDIFFEDRTYPHFLQLYAKCVEPAVDTYAYCLLPNHLHCLVRIKTEEETPHISKNPRVPKDLSPAHLFSILLNAYTKGINKAYDRTGNLFQKPFGRIQIASDVHFVHLVSYIHQNPKKHGLAEDFRDWPHSSYRALLSDEPTQLKRGEVLAWFDGLAAFRQFHQQPAVEALIADLVPGDFD